MEDKKFLDAIAGDKGNFVPYAKYAGWLEEQKRYKESEDYYSQCLKIK